MSGDSRRPQRQQPPPLAAAFASLSSAVNEARRQFGNGGLKAIGPHAAATTSAASTASAPLFAAAATRGAIKAPAARLPGGEKVGIAKGGEESRRKKKPCR